jgi:hypothetical protein
MRSYLYHLSTGSQMATTDKRIERVTQETRHTLGQSGQNRFRVLAGDVTETK